TSEVVERVGEQNRGSRGARELYLARGELEPGLLLPEVHRCQVEGHAEPIKPTLLGEIRTQRGGQRWRRGGVPVCQPDRETSQQSLARGERLIVERCAPCRARDLERVIGAREFAGVNRRDHRLQMRIACQIGIKRLKPLGGSKEQWGSVTSASKVEGDLR